MKNVNLFLIKIKSSIILIFLIFLSLNAKASIKEVVLSANRACAGDVISLKYYSDSIFLTSNTFQLQLSDSSGSFTTPQILSTITSTVSNGTIQGTLPSSLLSSNHYKLRIVSSAPNFISVSTSYLAVIGIRSAILNSSTVCAPVRIIANTNVKSPTIYSWYKDGNLIGNKIPSYNPNGKVIAGYLQNNYTGYLNAPNGIFVTDNGYVYVADEQNHRVVRINPTYTAMTVVAGGNGSGSALNQLNAPATIFVDKDENIFIADASNNRIMKWAKSATAGVVVAGSATGVSGSANNRLNTPQGVFVDATGNIFIGDMENHRVMRWAPNATTGVRVAGTGTAGNGATGLNQPMKVFIDINGFLYVADKNNGRVQKFTLGNLNGTTVAGGNGWGQELNQITNPFGLFVDINGNVFVSDHNSSRVLRWAPGENYADLVAGGRGMGTSFNQTYNPNGVFVDKFGKMYVVERSSNTVKVFDPIATNTDTIYVNTAGQYTVKIKDYALGCAEVTSSPLKINKPIAKITSSKGNIICANDTTILSTPTGIRYSYVWQKNGINISGAISNSLSVSTVGSYRVIVSDSTSCRDTSTVFNIYANPVINLTANGLCVGNELIATSTDTFPNVISWYKDGVAFKTKLPQFQTEGTVIAGTGGNFSLSLNAPDGFCIDRLGNYYIADQENHRVVKVFADQSGFEIVAGGNGYGNALNQLYAPASIYIDDDFTIYIADRNNNRIVKWEKNATVGIVVAGSATGTAGNALNRLNNPNGVYVDANGTIFIADKDNHRIVKWLKNATIGTLVAGTGVAGNGSTGLNNPWVVFVDNIGNVYVGDKENQRVQMFPPNSSNGITVAGGNGWGTLPNQISNPFALYVDGFGNIYVSDHNNSRVLRYPKGSLNGEVVAGGNGDGLMLNQTRYPNGIAIGLDGKLYVTERGNNRVIAFDIIKANNDTLKATVQGNYHVKYQNYLFGCSATSVIKSIKKPIVNLVSSLGNNICQGDTSTLTTTLDTSYTYRWQKNNIYITGANSNTLIASQVGSYRVIVTDKNSCADTSSIFSILSLPSATITSNGNCSNSRLILNSSDTTVSLISWYKDGQVVKEKQAQYDNTGKTILGTGGLNTTNVSIEGYITTDKFNNIYFVDIMQSRVMRISANGTDLRVVAGGNGNGSALNQLSSPQGIFVDNNLNLFIADANNHRIVKWANGANAGVIVAGSANSMSGSSLGFLNNPSSIYVDETDAIYISDVNNHRVVKWVKNASIGLIIAGTGVSGTASNQLNYPRSIYLNSLGELFVLDNSNYRIQKFLPGSLTGITIAGGNGYGGANNQISGAGQMYVDKYDNIYLSDNMFNKIFCWRKGAITSATILSFPSINYNYFYPNGITFDNNNQMLVSNGSKINLYKRLLLQRDTIITKEAGSYNAILTNSIGCTKPTTSVNIYKPIVKLVSTKGDNLCEGDSTILSTIKDSTYTYLWQKNGSTITGQTNNSLKVSQSGVYRVIVKDKNSCADTSSIFTVNPLPTVSITSSGSCAGSQLIANSSNTNLGQISWYRDGSLLKQKHVKFQSTGTVLFNVSGIQGMTIDKNGDYYLVDNMSHKVTKYSADGTTIKVVAGGNGYGTALNQLNYPSKVFVDNNLNVYVLDKSNHRVVKWLPNASSGIVVAGSASGVSGSGLSSLNSPSNLYVDENEAVYVSDENNHRIVKWTKGSTAGVVVAGTGTSGSSSNQLSNPIAIYVDANATIYVLDRYNYRVQKFVNGSLNGITVAGGNGSGDALNQINGDEIFVDVFKNIYFTHNGSGMMSNSNRSIRRWSPNATQSEIIIQDQSSPSSFYPNQILLDKAGNLVVSTYSKVFQYTPIPLQRDTLNTIEKGNYVSVVNSLVTACAGISNTKYLSKPTASIISYNNTSVCEGDTLKVTAVSDTSYTYRWQRNGINIANATTRNLVATIPGIYRLIVATQNSCADTSSTFSILSLPSATIASNGNCSNSRLILSSSDTTVSQISWYKDGQVVKQKQAQYGNTGKTIIGTGGLNTTSVNIDGYITTDKFNNIYFVESMQNRVMRISANGTDLKVVAGGNGNGSALNQLSSPNGIFVDNNLNVFIADANNHRIVKWANGAIAGVVVAGKTGLSFSSLDKLNYPKDLFVTESGVIYINDANNHRILKWLPGDTSGTIVAGTGVSGSASNQLNYPGSIHVNSSGELYVLDNSNYRVQKFLPGSSIGITVAGGNGYGSANNQITSSGKMYVDKFDNIYIPDNMFSRINCWSKGANSGSTILNFPMVNLISFFPNGITFNSKGEMLVCNYSKLNVHSRLLLQRDTITTKEAGSYIAILTNSIGCSKPTSAVSIYKPIVKLVSSLGDKVCDGDTTILSTLKDSTYTYIWQKNGSTISGQINNSLKVSQVGTYRVIVRDNKSCSDTSSVITINSIPTATIASSSTCLGSSLTSNSPKTNLSIISWYKNNQLIKRTKPNYNIYGSLLSFGTNVNGGTGSGSQLYLNAPDGFFIDKAGNYYISDQENHRVVKVAANKSTYQIVAGGNGFGSALNQLYGPASIFVDDDYNLFIADKLNNRIVKWVPGASAGIIVAGSSASLAGNALNRLNNPNGVFVDKSGTIFIADQANHRIVKWLKNATTGILVAGNGNPNGGSTGLSSPWVLFVDAVGNIYVGDKDNQRVQMFAPNSNTGTTVAGGIGWGTTPSHITNPFGLFVDDYGNIFVSDHNNNRVLRFTKGSLDGEVVAGGNGQGALSNQTSTPNGIFVDPKGVLYVVERSNNRVNTFNPIIINRDTITATSRGNYFVKYTDYETRCSGNSAVISPIPKIFSKDSIRVFGVDTTLYADTTTYQTFLWSNGSTANKIKVSQTGIYSLNAKINATNCNREDQLFVYFGNAKIANAFSTICSDDSIILRANTNKLGAKTQLLIDSAFVYGNGSLNFFNNDSVNMYSWSSGSPGYVVLGNADAKYGEISANVVSPNSSIKASVVMAMQKEYPANQPTYYAGSAALVFSIYTNGASIENSIPNSPYSPTILKSVTIPNLLTSVKHNISMKHTYDDTLRCYLDGVEVLKMSTINLKVKAGKFALRGDNTSYIFSKINFQKYDAKIIWNTGDTTFAIKKTPLVTTGYSFVLSDNNYKFKDTATVNVLQSPIAAIQPADSAFCSGDSLLLTANTGTGLTYQWKLNGINIAGATNANYFAKAAGNYTVQVKSANNCIKTSILKKLIINSLPTSSITSIKTSFCIGDSVNLIGNAVTGLTYQWKLNGTNIVGATNANFYAKQSGQYTLEVTNTKGCKKLSVVKTMTAIDFPNATVTAQSPITFCQGGTVTLSATTGTSLNYVWKKNNVNISGATTASYIANASGSYTVTITNSTGCAITSTPIVVTVNVLPIATITNIGSTSTCQGDSIKLKSNVETGFTYQWKRNLVNIPNAIDSNYFAKQSGSYTVAITNANGCLKESTTKTVTINALPIVNLNPINAICLLSAPIQLTGGSPSGGVYSGIAVANGFFNPKTAGVGLHNITYTYTDANGCINSSVRLIEVKQMPINKVNANGPIIFCKGSSVSLTVAMEPGKTFIWYKDGIQISNIGNILSVANSGSYHAVVTSNGCTINTDTIQVTVRPLPIVAIAPTGPTIICSGFNTSLKASGDLNLNYQWIKDNSTISSAIDSNLIVNASGSYRVIATNQNGCLDTSNAVNITVLNYPAAIATASSNTNFCIGDSVKISANTGTDLSYQWFKNGSLIAGAIDSFYYAKLDGNYTVSVTLSNLCSTLSNAINITTNPLPISIISSLNGVDFCSGDTLELQGNVASNVTYQWYLNNNLLPTETNRKIKATQQGNYMLRVRDINACDKFSDNFPIQFYNAPYSQELICAISVDSLTGKNVVVFEKTAGVRTEKFNIYREGSITGQYDLIGTLNYNQMSTYVDNTANPLSQSYRYKIAVIDSCGFESAKSPLHRTIHLSSNIGVNGEINLAWAPYEGVNYLTHRILRSLNGAPFQTIASVSGATFSYTDLMAPAGPKYYRIEIDVPGGCNPTAMVQGYTRILSNPVAIASNGVTNENYQASLINLYPNPTNGIVYVEGIINNNEVEVEIYDGIGKLLKIVKLNNDSTIDMSAFTPGVYSFKIENRVQRIVKM